HERLPRWTGALAKPLLLGSNLDPETLPEGRPMIFNPRTYDPAFLDAESRRLLRATVDFFEERGKKALMAGYADRVWYSDFLDFAAKEGLFATFLTPSADDPAADGSAKRWDTAR